MLIDQYRYRIYIHIKIESMATRTKMTPFARLLLVILIVAPLAFVGASIYNGEDPMANLKDLVGIEEKASSNTTNDLETMSKAELINKIESLEIRIDQLERKLSNMEQ